MKLKLSTTQGLNHTAGGKGNQVVEESDEDSDVPSEETSLIDTEFHETDKEEQALSEV